MPARVSGTYRNVASLDLALLRSGPIRVDVPDPVGGFCGVQVVADRHHGVEVGVAEQVEDPRSGLRSSWGVWVVDCGGDDVDHAQWYAEALDDVHPGESRGRDVVGQAASEVGAGRRGAVERSHH